MNNIHILFANIGWMTHYRGNNKKDKIVGGGSYRNDDKHEAFNFMPINGRCYGYVQTVRSSELSLCRIDKDCIYQDRLDNVLVVWISNHPQAGGTYIVGWYRNATVFSKYQELSYSIRNNYGYNIMAKEEDCTLVPLDQRTFLVPRARSKAKGFLGQSNVWYADAPSKEVQQFRKEVIDYIQNYARGRKTFSKLSLMVDSEARKQVEKAAVSFVTKEYQRLGYKVTSREKENIGWDLDAEKGGVRLKLEVKGLAQSQISIHISSNEYNSMKAYKDSYRLCVVTNAVSNPTLVKFIWDEGLNAWVSDLDESIVLTIDMKPSYLAVVE